MKASWKGSLSFGLVSIPVELYSAVKNRPEELDFKMLCAVCKNPIHYRRYCDYCHEERSLDQIVKGVKINGEYKIITQEALAALRPKKSETIDIIETIDVALVDPLYYQAHFYIIPDKKGEKAYLVFVRALADAQKGALARFSMKSKEHIALIRSVDGMLLLSTLHFMHDIQKVPAHSFKGIRISDSELEMARALIKQIATKTFDIQRFRDEFIKAVKKELKKTVRIPSKKQRTHEKSKEAQGPSLLQSLKASLQSKEGKKTRTSGKPTVKKKAVR